jgi:hypothetical protein
VRIFIKYIMGTCETIWTKSNEYEIFFKNSQKNKYMIFLGFLGIKKFHGLIHGFNSSNEFTFF